MSVVVERVAGGPIRTQIELNGPALRAFSQSDQATILRTCMRAAAELWIATFLPLRFTNYAKSLGYRASGKWETNKIRLAQRGVIASPQPTPMVYTGIARSTALDGSRAEATSTKGNAYAIIRIPFGHPIQPETSLAFKTIPANEVKRMAEVFGELLGELINKGLATGRTNGAQRTVQGSTSPVRSISAGAQRRVA